MPLPAGFKPLLAASMDVDKGQSIETLKYPLWATPKLDGIRNVQDDRVSLSRSLKRIPNAFIQRELAHEVLDSLDGEIITYTDGKMDDFNDVQSKVMSEDGEPDFKLVVFDVVPANGETYLERMERLRRIQTTTTGLRVGYLFPIRVDTPLQLRALVDQWLAEGFEGGMVRGPQGLYKFNRATFKENILTKVKPFESSEATIAGFVEQLENQNEATEDELGHTKRSSHKANKVGKGTLGKFICQHPEFGEIKIGTGKGLTNKLRDEVWADRPAFLGRTIKFKFQRIGSIDKPRIAIFEGFRDPRDMS